MLSRAASAVVSHRRRASRQAAGDSRGLGGAAGSEFCSGTGASLGAPTFDASVGGGGDASVSPVDTKRCSPLASVTSTRPSSTRTQDFPDAAPTVK